MRPRTTDILAALALATAVFATAPAAADECRIDENCEIRVESLDYSGTWQWRLEAELGIDGRLDSDARREHEVTASVGGEVAYDGKTCRWFGVGGDLGGYWDGADFGLTGRQELTFCLPYPVFRPELRVALDQDLRPRLSAAPTVRATRVRGGSIAMHVHALHLSATTKDGRVQDLRLFVFGGGFGFVTQDVADAPLRTNRTHFELDIIRGIESGTGFLGHDRELRIMRVAGEFRANANDDSPLGNLDVAAFQIPILELVGARIPRTSWYYDLSAGLAVGDMTQVQVLSPHVKAYVMGGTAERAYGAGYGRTVQSTNYSALLLEDRLAGWWRQGGDGNATTIHGFGALTQVVDSAGQSTRTLTAGVGVDRDMLAGDHLRLALSAEFARSFYATLHGDAPLEAAWVGQVSIRANAARGSR